MVAMQRDLRRAHTQGFVDDVWAKFVAGDPEMAASLTAVTSVLSVADRVLSASPVGQLSGLAMVRPAGLHSTTDRQGPLCVINSVMVAALREAAAGSTVGVLDIDVHFATGSQQIALQWNERKAASEGRVLVADIYGAMGPPARFVEKAQKVQREHGAVDAAALKAEMSVEFPSATPQEQEVIDMVCDSHLLFPFDREELDDEALFASTARSVRHFLEHKVETRVRFAWPGRRGWRSSGSQGHAQWLRACDGNAAEERAQTRICAGRRVRHRQSRRWQQALWKRECVQS